MSEKSPDERLAETSERYIGERIRALWSTLTDEQKTAMLDDADEQEAEDWSDGIDSMGEDA